jgi:hypothetical protein
MNQRPRKPGDPIISYITYDNKTGEIEDLLTVRKGADDAPDYSHVIFCFLNHIGRA